MGELRGAVISVTAEMHCVSVVVPCVSTGGSYRKPAFKQIRLSPGTSTFPLTFAIGQCRFHYGGLFHGPEVMLGGYAQKTTFFFVLCLHGIHIQLACSMNQNEI